MRESELERILVEEVRKEGGIAYKWVSPGNDGVPDRIVFFPGGEVYFVELKTERGVVSSKQSIQVRKLRGLGQEAAIVKGIGGLIGFFRDAGKAHIANRLMKKYAEEVIIK